MDKEEFKKSIEEGNKLIATFMGYKYYPHPEQYPGWRKEINISISKLGGPKYRPDILCRTTREIPYFNSWNYLMSVIDKIHTINRQENKYVETDYTVSLNKKVSSIMVNIRNSGNINGTMVTYSRCDVEEYTMLQRTFFAIVDFIKKFNYESNEQ